jgi:hypothetical protein
MRKIIGHWGLVISHWLLVIRIWVLVVGFLLVGGCEFTPRPTDTPLEGGQGQRNSGEILRSAQDDNKTETDKSFIQDEDVRYVVDYDTFFIPYRSETGLTLDIKIISPKVLDKETGEKYGCTDPLAYNYCISCTQDDGTCLYLAARNE